MFDNAKKEKNNNGKFSNKWMQLKLSVRFHRKDYLRVQETNKPNSKKMKNEWLQKTKKA